MQYEELDLVDLLESGTKVKQYEETLLYIRQQLDKGGTSARSNIAAAVNQALGIDAEEHSKVLERKDI